MTDYSLDDKWRDIKKVAHKVLENQQLFNELLSGVKSKDDTIRSNSFKTLLLISEEEPEFLYPKWDYFQEMLKSPNSYHKYVAIYILANLTSVDEENRFNDIFHDYYGIFGGEKVMTASHVALNSPNIIKNKPELESKIIETFLNIDTIHKGKQKELVKAYIIEALIKIYPDAHDKDKIQEFVESQLESSSPKTRDLASCFLDIC